MNAHAIQARETQSARRHTHKSGNRRRARRRLEMWLSVTSPLLLLAVWEIVGALHLIDLRFFPKPSTIAVTLWHLILLGDLWIDFKASVFRIFWGFLLGSIPALVLGVAMGLSRPLRFVLNPIVYSTYPIPKIAVLPLVILIFGIGESSKIVVVAIGAFYLVLINTIAGVISIDTIYFDVAKNFCLRRRDLYLRVILPAALPLMIAGLKLALGVSLLLIVAAEMLGAEHGIGHMIWESWQTFTVPKMYGGLIIISATGYILSVIADQIERALLPWRD